MLKPLLLLFFFCASGYASSKKLLTLGAVHYPPYFVFGVEEPKGILVDLLKLKLGSKYDLNFVQIPLSRGEQALHSGAIDSYLGYSKLQERDLEYSKKPYYVLQPMFCGLSSKPIDLEDIRGKRLVYPRGTKVVEEIRSKKPKITFTGYYGNYVERMLKMLKANRADFFVVPEDRNFKILSKKHENFRCAELDRALPIFFAFKPGNGLKQVIDDLL